MSERRAVAAVLLCLAVLLTGCSKSAAGAGQAAEPKHTSVVAFLGDSYTAGIAGTTRDETYAALTARKLGWQVIVAGQAGTGLLAPGHHGHTFGQLYDEQLAWRPAPDMVIIAGGHNDWPYPASLEQTSARRLVDRMRERWPHTHLLLIGPMWGSGEPRTEALSIRDAWKKAASKVHVPFIDPLGERWITGSRDSGTGNATRYIRDDNTHPNAAGHQYFADRLVTDLRKLGLAEPIAGRGAHPPRASG